jgi:hypothetical protein
MHMILLSDPPRTGYLKGEPPDPSDRRDLDGAGVSPVAEFLFSEFFAFVD